MNNTLLGVRSGPAYYACKANVLDNLEAKLSKEGAVSCLTSPNRPENRFKRKSSSYQLWIQPELPGHRRIDFYDANGSYVSYDIHEQSAWMLFIEPGIFLNSPI